MYTRGWPDDPHQPRPALVVSENVRNQARPHVTVVPIFSVGRTGPNRLPIEVGVGGIPHGSVLFCEEITTIHDEFIADGPLGEPVSDELLERVVRGVRRALGDVVPEP